MLKLLYTRFLNENIKDTKVYATCHPLNVPSKNLLIKFGGITTDTLIPNHKDPRIPFYLSKVNIDNSLGMKKEIKWEILEDTFSILQKNNKGSNLNICP